MFEVMRLGRRTATQATLSTGSQATADDEVESGKSVRFVRHRLRLTNQQGDLDSALEPSNSFHTSWQAIPHSAASLSSCLLC